MMRIRHLLGSFFAAAFMMVLAPAGAYADDFRVSLTELLPELKQSYEEALTSDSLLVDNSARRQELSEIVRAADEVAIMLYTQQTGFAFDMAFALEKVGEVYDSFREKAGLSDKYLIASRSGLRRYSLLSETLRDMYMSHPLDSLRVTDSLLQDLPQLEPLWEEDPEEKAVLDSCMMYTDSLTALFGRSVMLALQDSIVYAETGRRLQQAYDYAQDNYAETQKNIFIGGNVNVVNIVRNWDSFISTVRNDLKNRFSVDTPPDGRDGKSIDERKLSAKSIPRYAVISLFALLLAFLLAAAINAFIFKFVRNSKAHELKPILSAIFAILLFVASIILVNTDRGDPYWRMAYRLLSQFFWLTLAIFVSLLIRIQGSQARPSRNIYLPTMLLAFLNILLRAVFLPASLVPLIFPPALLIFIIWQSGANIRYRSKVDRTDLRYMWVSVGVMAASCILSLSGYSMVGVLLLTFWTFQLALLHTITTIYYLMKRYYENSVTRRKARYHVENPFLPMEDKDAFIEVTWFYDLIRMVVVPITILLSVLLSIQLTSRAYQLSLAGADILNQPLFRREGMQSLTLFNILLIIALFFVFRYLIYIVKAMARLIKMRGIIERKHPAELPLKESDVNLSLPNALFTLLGWLIYLIIVFSILHVPTKALTTITTGLAAGIGFALKDLINNFFYGVQLMAGRIRVGDKIACDGVRGIVKRVSYQTTLVEDEDGSYIAFTNTELFTKQFRNLSSGRNYEFIKIPVGVRYGTDVDRARQVILDALKPLMTQDKAGNDIVDPTFPIDVRFDGFGENSVQLVVALYTTVETHYTFPARAKEAIYNAFHEHGIEIPFPQQDVYIKSVPDQPVSDGGQS
ncbi:MAG: mechanosensitive ion channel [Bacteroidales bacterium]|nr:mechanosensitive ion channel [Bacteroidales bacterium]